MSNTKLQVPVVFSTIEAETLAYAASNSMGHGDVAEALFPDPSDRMAARRAYRKLLDAVEANKRKRGEV